MYTNNLRILWLGISLALFLLTSGCSHSEHKDLSIYISNLRKQAETKHSQSMQPSKEFKWPLAVTYQASGLKSPFVEFGPQTKVKAEGSTNPLQMYPINMLRFVGTLTRNNMIYAYILAPDGMIYSIRTGDVIGDRNGKVISVERNQVTIREEDLEIGKPSMQHLITLQLKEE